MKAKALWRVTSSRIELLFVALGVLLADAGDRSHTVHIQPTPDAFD